ncbi:uncharacterized protein LOC122384685 [Amphibalanus amphitrite]|uniref:uncharacterized protein LOC122384685 n=1 Tax=Amphibalanus amphitrite TaxID=1232801 RepID=UPI001C923D4A|nr:uncharacterized protein LOC122384685 [Amphibalanus amphitrite]
MLSTEYRLKFQDFSGGSAPPSDASCPDGGVRGLGRAKTWYSDLLESRRKAVTYKVRGWGKESAPSHLVYLYDQAEDPSRPPEKKIISALYLETLQPGLSRGRTPVPDRSRAGTADSTDGRGRTAAAVSRPLPPHAAAAAAARKASAKVRSLSSGRVCALSTSPERNLSPSTGRQLPKGVARRSWRLDGPCYQGSARRRRI